ncbi:MAG: sugar ABC transporter substrate-binding protein [Alphaproteobacteria bacterium]|nr:sugar ABC transporter substrate-binding protein [Alphaproteobacteria bacterium]
MKGTLLIGAVAAVAAASLSAITPASAQGMDAAKKMIAEHRMKPVFSAPGPAFDAKSCAAGKRILTIPVSSANPFTKNIALAMIAAAKEVGVEVVEWENQYSPVQWAQGMNFAINEKFDLIDLLGGIDPGVMVPQIQAAKNAGIKVKTSHFYDMTQDPHPSLDGYVPLSFYKVGQIIANWTIVQSGGKANVVIIGSDEIVPTAPFVKGIRDTLKANCPDCQEKAYINAPVAEWATKIQTSTQSALMANPDVNYLIPIYDSMSGFAFPGIRIAGKTNSVKIATFNGTPFVLDMIQAGQVEMDVGESLGWIGRAILDSHMRTLCGLAEPKELNVPFYIFDKSNAKDAGTPADSDRGYGDVHVAGFRKLWGIE